LSELDKITQKRGADNRLIPNKWTDLVIKQYIMIVLQAVILYAFVLVCPCTIFMPSVLAPDALHPYLSLHTIRELPFAVQMTSPE
jgi:hypothetical protein